MDKAEYRKSVINNINNHGFHSTTVAGEEGDPTYTYSTGIQETLNAPELITIGLGSSLAHTLSHIYYDRVKAGETFVENHKYEGFLKGVTVMFKTVPLEKINEYMLCVPWLYGDKPHRALQLIYPDDNHLWPWDEGVHASVIRCQPILCEIE